MGQVMVQKQLTSLSTQVNVQPFPAGIYYITIKGEAGVEVKKFEKL